jgi:hypothetical protein
MEIIGDLIALCKEAGLLPELLDELNEDLAA